LQGTVNLKPLLKETTDPRFDLPQQHVLSLKDEAVDEIPKKDHFSEACILNDQVRQEKRCEVRRRRNT
jgi:hypothetical protein